MPMRIAGLSGFDVDNTVKELMKAHRVPVDKLAQKKQTYEWQRDAYRDMNLKVTDFRNNKLFNFKAEGTFNKKTITIAGNSEAITAKATASAANGTLTIGVTSLAGAAANFSENAVANDSFDPSKPLATQNSNLTHGTPVPSIYKFKINGSEEISVDTAKESLNDVIAKINRETNVTALYDAVNKKISFTAQNTGTTNGPEKNGQYIIFEDKTGNFLNTVAQISTLGANKVGGTDAQVTINGLVTTRKSNTFTVNGIEITLNKAGGANAIVSPKTNTDEIFESIKTFVTDYNDVLKTLQDKVSEQRNRDYEPLTDEQKGTLSEKQIEQWEERAKKGQLGNDQILSKIILNLRTAISDQVDTGNKDIRSLADIGIKTGQYYEKGKLYIENETKLREAIEQNPEAVKALFTQDAKDGGSGTEVGIGERMYSKLNEGLNELTSKAGLASIILDDSRLSKQISDVSKVISEKKYKLQTLEDNYYKKFAAMESALNRYNQQSQYLANQFGIGQQ